MTSPRLRRIAVSSVALTLAAGCLPERNLDAAASGNGTGGRDQTSANQGGAAQTDNSATDPVDGTGGNISGTVEPSTTGGRSDLPPTSTGGTLTGTRTAALPKGGAPPDSKTSLAPEGGTKSSSNEASSNLGGATNSTSGDNPTGGTQPAITTTSGGIAANLVELTNSPVEGAINLSGGNWDIYGVQQDAFRIETPTATYFVVKSVAAIASLADQNGVLWLNFSWAFVPNRGIPNLGGCCQLVPPSGSGQPEMTTVLDTQSETSTHVRLVSRPKDGDYYWLVWDFFLTHMTLTINRSEEPYGFTFDGVPGNVLEASDQLVLSTGVKQKATTTYSGDLPGPVEWAYLTNPGESKPGSLFLIQHGDDNLPEAYSVTDASGTKGSRFVFGGGQITTTPLRFSLGLIDSVDDTTISERISYVIENTPR